MKKSIFILVITILSVAVLVSGCGNKAATPAAGQEKSAPKISLSGLDNLTYTLPQYGDKPTLIFFWASWCPDCNREAPELVKIHQEFKDKINIYGVNLTSRDTIEDAKQFVKKYGIIAR